MRRDFSRWILGAALLAGTSAAQWLKQPTSGIPRTADGKPDRTAPAPRAADGRPDLTGLWAVLPGPAAGNIAKDLGPGEIQPWAAELHRQRKDNLGSDYFGVTCLPAGPLYSLGGSPEGVKIVQTHGLIVFLYGDLAYRQVHLDGREPPQDPNPAWLGYSVGRWDGDTLVVESNGFNDRTWLDFEGHPHSEELLMTERYRRVNLGEMELEVTFRDPKVYAKPLRATAKMEAIFDTEMLEYVCAENEKSRAHLVGKASDEKGVKVSEAILRRYTGDYEIPVFPGGPPDRPTRLRVALVDGRLEIQLENGPAGELTPLTETTFSGLGSTIEFVSDAQGNVTHMTFRIVEGDIEAKRKP
jgi:hypothetical protein